MNSLICNQALRRESVRQHTQLNGLDYLEIGKTQQTEQTEPSLDAQRVLTAYFLGRVAANLVLDKTQVRIEGGQRIRDIQVLSVTVHTAESIEFDDYMTVVVDRPGDFSTYILRVVEKNEQGEWQPHTQFDPHYDRIAFNFKVDCPNEFDCKQEAVCPPEHREEPDINYLAKDYASFRQLMLDRLALVLPDWRERHVPDVGIALVEILAYVGDHLSYYQDAVATEAYLDTARKRISVRRHARLVDYSMHEGCNARTWVCVQVNSDSPSIQPEDIFFITGVNEALQDKRFVLTLDELKLYAANSYEVFEPIADGNISLYKDHNNIIFYTWSNQLCCLPRGSTSATLIGEWISPNEPEPCEHDSEPEVLSSETYTSKGTSLIKISDVVQLSTVKLRLKPGDVLIFEEVMGPETGHPQDADPKHRHAVRLKTIESDVDPLNGQSITHITWGNEDALPFPLCLSVLGPPSECIMLENVSVARGNVLLVDHGQTVEEDLDEVPGGEIIECCKREGMLADSYQIPGKYRPVLKYMPLTFSEPVDNNKPASAQLKQEVRRAIPMIRLINPSATAVEQRWDPRPDLLSSQGNDLHFVAELENEGHAHLRFGNGEMGRRPDAGMIFHAKYRVGNGLAGNIGAESISHLVVRNASIRGVSLVRNPMPAQGGTAAEPISEVKLFAPHTFRKELQRAITAEDYAAIVLREFKHKVQNAFAKLRWNGSWFEVLIAIDPYGQEQADQALLDEISERLHRYRRMGHDVVVKSAWRIPLDIELRVCVLPHYLRGHVKAALLKIFSNKKWPDGSLGFFHPDNLTFGEDIYLSKLIGVAHSVEGIESVTVTRMQRWCEIANNEIENGLLPLDPFEIARLDNDSNFPENGKLSLDMRGGR